MAYADVVVSHGPLAYWRCNDSGSTLAEYLGNPSWPASVMGLPGMEQPALTVGDATAKSIAFDDDTGDHAKVIGSAYDEGLYFVGDCTVSFWFKTEIASAVDDVAAFGSSWRIYLPDGKPTFGITVIDLESEVWYAEVQAPSAFNDGNPHFLVAQRDGPDLKLFVDGSLVATHTPTEFDETATITNQWVGETGLKFGVIID